MSDAKQIDHPELGDKVKDRITGFEGVVDSTHQYLSGLKQCGVLPLQLKNGIPQRIQFIESPQLEVIQAGFVDATKLQHIPPE